MYKTKKQLINIYLNGINRTDEGAVRFTRTSKNAGIMSYVENGEIINKGMVYENTLIINTDSKVLDMNNDGYYTRTTKANINKFIQNMNINAKVFQKRGEWIYENLNNNIKLSFKNDKLSIGLR